MSPNITITLTATPELLTVFERFAQALERLGGFAGCSYGGVSRTVTPGGAGIGAAGGVGGGAPEPQPSASAAPQTVTPPPSAATPTAPQPVPLAGSTAPPPVPLAQAPAYTSDQIMTAGAALIDAGKINDLLQLLSSFGVQAVTQLKPEQYGAFATELRKLGAHI